MSACSEAMYFSLSSRSSRMKTSLISSISCWKQRRETCWLLLFFFLCLSRLSHIDCDQLSVSVVIHTHTHTHQKKMSARINHFNGCSVVCATALVWIKTAHESDLWSGTLFLSLSGIRLHSLKSKLKTLFFCTLICCCFCSHSTNSLPVMHVLVVNVHVYVKLIASNACICSECACVCASVHDEMIIGLCLCKRSRLWWDGAT